MNKTKPKIRIEVIVEGMTEENYLIEFIEDSNIDIFNDKILNFNFHNVKGGSYYSITKKIRSFRSLDSTIFIVTDIDRLANDENELNDFKTMLKELNKFKYSFAFITYPNFEGFLSSHFNPYENSILKKLRLKSTDELKSKKDIYSYIIKNNGNFNNILKRYKKENLCCSKVNNKTEFDKSKIRLEQSSFIYFISYCESLKNKK
ncbi:RloB domain-containing protein [Campylobacter hyointestinalis]|uniref:RloB domain-containing protein n=1 Tax=Campylobacter hyointestinalis TaxID=198 RepID=UPI0011ACBB99|nr:RloB domain-containing protein [Campylobacter hyointestinalis]TWO18731.1 hypothetical protein YZ80_08555 [Campylobacter hyointestinalis]